MENISKSPKHLPGCILNNRNRLIFLEEQKENISRNHLITAVFNTVRTNMNYYLYYAIGILFLIILIAYLINTKIYTRFSTNCFWLLYALSYIKIFGVLGYSWYLIAALDVTSIKVNEYETSVSIYNIFNRCYWIIEASIMILLTITAMAINFACLYSAQCLKHYRSHHSIKVLYSRRVYFPLIFFCLFISHVITPNTNILVPLLVNLRDIFVIFGTFTSMLWLFYESHMSMKICKINTERLIKQDKILTEVTVIGKEDRNELELKNTVEKSKSNELGRMGEEEDNFYYALEYKFPDYESITDSPGNIESKHQCTKLMGGGDASSGDSGNRSGLGNKPEADNRSEAGSGVTICNRCEKKIKLLDSDTLKLTSVELDIIRELNCSLPRSQYDVLPHYPLKCAHDMNLCCKPSTSQESENNITNNTNMIYNNIYNAVAEPIYVHMHNDMSTCKLCANNIKTNHPNIIITLNEPEDNSVGSVEIINDVSPIQEKEDHSVGSVMTTRNLSPIQEEEDLPSTIKVN